MPNVSPISLLSFQPRRLWRLVCVGAALHDSRDVLAKLSLDITQSFRAATILNRVMQQGRDRFRFVRAVLHRDRGHTEDMRDVGDPCLFPELSAVNPRGVSQCFFELTRESHSYVSLQRPS